MICKTIELYEGRKDVTLTTYVLADSPEMLNGKKRPAVLICPGGAYLSCSDREGEPVAMKFAAMGYHAFVLRYSVFGEGEGGFPDMTQKPQPKPQCQYPNPMNEIGMAMDIICDHAEEWHVNVDKIAICGFSAGAHNCAMYAAYWHTLSVGRKPAAAILGYCLSDYIYMYEHALGSDPMAKGLFELSALSYFGTSEPTPEMLDTASACRHVTEHMPPTFLWATAGDNLVPVVHTIRMSEALAEHKIPFEVHIFEEGDHGLAVSTQASAGAWSETNKDAAKWMDLCEAWLEKRFKFDLPELNDFQMRMQEMGK